MIFACIYVGSVVSRLSLRIGFEVEAKKRAEKEGYAFVKKEKTLGTRVLSFLKEAYLTLVPGVNTISAIHYYVRSFDKYYKNVLKNGLPYGEESEIVNGVLVKKENVNNNEINDSKKTIKELIKDKNQKILELKKAKKEALKEKRKILSQARKNAREEANKTYEETYLKKLDEMSLKLVNR